MNNFSVPMDFDGLNLYNSMRSVAGRVQNDINTQYYMRALWQRAISGTTFRLPEAWKKARRYFKNVLFGLGYIGVIDSPQYGIIPQICTISGYGLFLQPTDLLVCQPLCEFEGTIGENCQVIHLGDYMGIWDIVEHYAIRLSIAITSLDCALMNERISILAAGKNKVAVETLKYLYEKISAGEPFAVYDKSALKSNDLDEKSEPIWTFSQDAQSQYISDKLLADIDTILQQFDREVGIAAIGEKKERMVTNEVDMQVEDSCARSTTWFECLSDSVALTNDLFAGLDIGFTMNYGGEAHEYNAKNDANRSL